MDRDGATSALETMDDISHSGNLSSATIEDGVLEVKFYAGSIANSYYTLRLPLDGSGLEVRTRPRSGEPSTYTFGEPADAEAVLRIPTEEDVGITEELLAGRYDELEDQYVRIPEEPRDEREEQVMTEGSLMQELLAQLRD